LCLVLDLDDTLFLERDYVRSGFESVGNWVRRKFRIDDFASRAYAQFEAGRRGKIFDSVFCEFPGTATPIDIQRMVRIYRSHKPEIAPSPDAAEFLAHWRDRCFLALISDGPVASQRRKLDALGLRQYFDTVVFTGLWTNRYAKPHRRAFQLVQSRFPSATKFFYVADNPTKDFHAPRAMGWSSVRIRRDGGLYASRDSLAGFEPGYDLPSLAALTPILMTYSNL
jgi:putative hydrolase of the HAD superfamily